VRATLLAEKGQTDEAIAECCSLGTGSEQPFHLAGREAWVRARVGQVEAAVARMQELVERNPDYRWGLACLDEWCASSGRTEARVKAARQLSALEPESAQAATRLAEALQQHGDRAAARAELLRARTLEPEAGYAALTLCDLELDEGDLTAASNALEQMPLDEPFAAARRAQIAARRGAAADAEAHARQAFGPEGNSWTVDTALQALRSQGFVREAERALEAAVLGPEVCDAAIERWSQGAAVRRSFWTAWPVLEQLRGRGRSGVGALTTWLETIGERRRGWALRGFLWTRRPWAESEPTLWGTVGYALLQQHRPRAAERWLQGWATREGVRPWMLVSVLLAALLRGRLVREALEKAMALPEDHARPQLEAFARWEAALKGSQPPSPAREGDGLVRCLHRLADAACLEGLREANEALALAAVDAGNAYGRGALQLTRRHLRDRHGWRGWVWWLLGVC
jgi:tetratricopeptide (TPR) repeat protein